MKAILISIKPEYVAKILNGEKTLEIRKSMPKDFRKLFLNNCDEGLDVYIYCTKEDNLMKLSNFRKDKYICGKEYDITDFVWLNIGYEGKGKVVAKFTLNKVEEIFTIGMYYHETKTLDKNELSRLSCLSRNDLDIYLQGENGYAWHIDNLEIFGKPKELTDFFVYSHTVSGEREDGSETKFDILKPLDKAPQSYCYIRDVL